MGGHQVAQILLHRRPEIAVVVQREHPARDLDRRVGDDQRAVSPSGRPSAPMAVVTKGSPAAIASIRRSLMPAPTRSGTIEDPRAQQDVRRIADVAAHDDRSVQGPVQRQNVRRWIGSDDHETHRRLHLGDERHDAARQVAGHASSFGDPGCQNAPKNTMSPPLVERWHRVR